jgi:hypothetical protein
MSDASNPPPNGNGISAELLSTIQKKAIEEVAKYAIIAFVALVSIAATGWWLYIRAHLSEWAGGVPQDAVVMFDTLAECPAGWTRLRKAEGRYLVGTWPGKEAGAVIGVELSPEENRPVGRHTHRLQPAGMHSHSINRSSGDGDGLFAKLTAVGSPFHSPGGKDRSGHDGVTEAGEHTHQLEAAGDKDGTNAPYLALLACKKNRS